MIRTTHDWSNGVMNWTPDEGGVALETVELSELKAEEATPETEPVPAEEVSEEPKPIPAKRDASKERRNLAGANWLDDWTVYFPAKRAPKPRKRKG